MNEVIPLVCIIVLMLLLMFIGIPAVLWLAHGWKAAVWGVATVSLILYVAAISVWAAEYLHVLK